MDKLLEHFIGESKNKWDAIESKLDKIDGTLLDLTKFKIEMVSTGKFISLLVSVVCGVVTIVISTVFNLMMK